MLLLDIRFVFFPIKVVDLT